VFEGGASTDPKKQLDNLRKALTGMGVSEDAFDKIWGRLAVKYQGNAKEVVDAVRTNVVRALEQAASGEADFSAPDY
jgi:hypothetical protein